MSPDWIMFCDECESDTTTTASLCSKCGATVCPECRAKHEAKCWEAQGPEEALR